MRALGRAASVLNNISGAISSPLTLRSCPRTAAESQRSCSGTAPESQIQRSLTSAVVQQLHQRGFAVLDGAHGREAAHAYQREIQQMQQDSLLHKNNTFLVKDETTTLLEKASIFEAELTLDPAVADQCPSLAKFDREAALPTLLSLYLEMTSPRQGQNNAFHLDSQAVKLQYNLGSVPATFLPLRPGF